MLFTLLVSGEQRRQLIAAKHALATRALSDKQFGKRHTRAGKIKIVRDAQLEALSRAYDIQKQALDHRQAAGDRRAEGRMEALSVERETPLGAMGAGIRTPPDAAAGSGIRQQLGDRQAPARPRRPVPEPTKTRSRNRRRPPNSPVKKKFEDKAVPKPEPILPSRGGSGAARRNGKRMEVTSRRQRPPKPKM